MTKPVKLTKGAKPRAKATGKSRSKSDSTQPTGKIASLVSLMRRPKGATLADLSKATGWQAHSVRGAISGSIKKKLGYDVQSARVEGARTYLIAN